MLNQRVLIWDLPTRAFHWLLVLSFITAVLTYEDNRFLYVHTFAGYSFFGLLVFRLIWGMVGSHYARFRAFAYAWPSVWAYLKGLLTGQAMRYVGHNPAGGWAIFLMIVLGLVVGITGILVLGGEEAHGPLAKVVPYEVGEAAKGLHDSAAWAMMSIVGLHIAAVIFESIVHKENLVWSMITGHKTVTAPGEHPGVERASIIGVILLTLVVGGGFYYFLGYLEETADQPYRPFIGPQLPDNTTWREACGECHLAFHPTLLPARSWQKMMETQADHFGDDLALDAQTSAEILSFMVQNAAESKQTEPARKMLRYLPADKTPLRITETEYWKRKHEEISQKYWDSKKVGSKSNCKACHLDAEEGTFEDSGMRLPKLIDTAQTAQ